MLMWAVYPKGSLGREAVDAPWLILRSVNGLVDERGEVFCVYITRLEEEGFVVKRVEVSVAPVRDREVFSK